MKATSGLQCTIFQLKVSNQNRKQREEMMTEARMMRDFRHPNIVRFYGYAIDHEPLLIVMEHVQVSLKVSVIET